MDDNQETLNQIALMEQALKFYADKKNYENNQHAGYEQLSLIEADNGSQARFALEQLKKIKNMNEEMGEDYIKLLEKELDKAKTPEGIKKLINEIKNVDKNG